MQVMPEDVLAGCVARFNATSVVSAITGGIYHEKQQTVAAVPYATISVEDGDKEFWSGLSYMAKFNVTIRVWDMAKTGGTGQYSRELSTAFDWTTALSVPNAVNVISVKPLPGTFGISPEPRNAEEVLAVSRRWEIMVTANRENQ